MAKLRVKISSKGALAILNDQKTRAVVQIHARRVADQVRARGLNASLRSGRTDRVVETVDTSQSIAAESRDGKVARALNAARR